MFICREEWTSLLNDIAVLEERVAALEELNDNQEKRICTYNQEFARLIINDKDHEDRLAQLEARLEELESRIDNDKAITDGINELMNYNPYDHVKGLI